MSVNSEESNYNELWSTLCADEQYAALCEYIQRKMGTIQRSLSDFRDEISDGISEEQCEAFNIIINSVCHPPPGCREE